MRTPWGLLAFVVLFSGFSSRVPVPKEGFKIESGRNVTLDYVLRSEGKIVDSSRKKGPLEFEFAKGRIWPAFEEHIEGMQAGEKKTFELAPEDAFGQWEIQNARVFFRSQLPEGKLKPGMMLTATNPETGKKLGGRITKIIGDEVGLDFNHPLAGKTLHVEVKILEVQ